MDCKEVYLLKVYDIYTYTYMPQNIYMATCGSLKSLGVWMSMIYTYTRLTLYTIIINIYMHNISFN
jgi:hypothetical protein